MINFKIESWIWYGFAISTVVLRFVARYVHFQSLLRFQVEDYLMLFVACVYTILIVFLNICTQVNTNLIPPGQDLNLTPTDIAQRTWGSKMILLVEQCMCATQWGCKACLLLLYWRLTRNLAQNLIVKLVALYVLLTYLVMEALYFGYWCRPFHDYWQTPTSNVQCTTALHHLILNLAFNLSSDLIILSIPLPLFLRIHLPWQRKVLLVLPFSLGFFVMLCAILSKHLSFTQPFSPVWVYWYCREASTAVIVANIPYSWVLIRRFSRVKSFLGESPDATRQNSNFGLPLSESISYTRSNASHHPPQPPPQTALSWKNRPLLGRKRDAIEITGDPGTDISTWHEKPTRQSKGSESLSMGSAPSASAAGPKHSTAAAAVDRLYNLDEFDDGVDEQEIGVEGWTDENTNEKRQRAPG